MVFSVVLLQDTDEDPLVIRNSGLAHRVATDEGKDYVFTVKLFLTRWDKKLVKQAVQASKAVDYLSNRLFKLHVVRPLMLIT